MRKTHAQRLAGSLKESGHRRGQPDGPLMPPDPRDRVGHLGDRIVGLEHGAVAGRAARDQSQPRDALLAGLEQVKALAADGGAEPADLPDRLANALYKL